MVFEDSVMMNDCLKGLSKTKTLNALKAQVQVKMKVVGCEPQRMVILGKKVLCRRTSRIDT